MSLAYIKQIFLNLVDNFTNFFKYNPVIKGFVAIWFYFAGIHIYMYAVATLLILDVITGIYASYKNNLPFTSKALKQGLLEKLALYMILLLCAFTLEHVFKSIFGWQRFFVVFFVTVLITTYECVSICENILRINPQLFFLKSLIGISNKLNKSAIKFVEKKIDDAILPDDKTVVGDSIKLDEEKQ